MRGPHCFYPARFKELTRTPCDSLRFKEIRSKEENLSALKKSRDSLAGRIDAQERKVSKMKEETKDLPTQRQRLRDMQQEMIGLENSVLTEETRCAPPPLKDALACSSLRVLTHTLSRRLSDFKRTATREALSLKLGAMLELAEKTVIVAELGKLIVDMLPVDETEPGQPRPYYEGHQRTEELLGEAQRCLQDVVFNPSPLTEGTSHPPHHHQSHAQYGQDLQQQQQYGEGAAHPTNQFDDSGIRAVHPSSEFGAHSTAGGQYADNSYASYQAPQLHTPRDEQGAHSGPQLQPLPDFRPLSVVGPGNGTEASPRQPSYYGGEYAPQDTASPRSPTGPDSYQSRAPMLAPPIQDERYNPDRSSLAYMGEAPLSDEPHHRREPAVQEEDDRAAGDEEHAREVAEREVQQQREYGYEQGHQQRYQPEQQYEAYPYSPPSEQHAEHSDLASPHAAGEGADEVSRRDMHGEAPVPHNAAAPLSPITEMPTPAPDQLEAGAPQQFAAEHPPSATTPVTRSNPASSHSHDAPAHGRSASADSRHRPGSVEGDPYSATASPAAPAYSAHPPPHAADVPSGPSASTSPISPAFVQQPAPSFAPSTFEPAPLGSKAGGDRRPIQIRTPQGEAALGSKYGDVFVPARAGVDGGPYSPAASSPRATPADAGLSGYFASPSGSGPNGAPLTPGGGDQKRTIAASAFRRPQQHQQQLVSYGAPGAGGSRFAASGYQYDPAVAAAEAAGLGPSESERIAAQWRDAATPEQREQARLEGYNVDEGQVPTPSFDTRPLQVNKQRQGSMPGPGGVGRSGTMPCVAPSPSHRYGS